MAALSPLNYANSFRACQHHDAGKTNEQPVLDHVRNHIQQTRQARRIGYSPQMGIDNPVATIGDKNVAVPVLSESHLPGNAASENAPPMARCVAASPNGTTSTGSGRPKTSTHLESSAITIMRSDAAATIFSRSSAPPPPLIRLSEGQR